MHTDDPAYSERLMELQRRPRWKRLLRVQEPYRRRLLSLDPGKTLDVGCGIGRSLAWLEGTGSVGVDHNSQAVAACREAGYTAFTAQEFVPQEWSGSFDTLLLAHVAEHMTEQQAADLVRHYLPALRPGGKVLIICPQQRGQASDPTHVTYMDAAALRRLAGAGDLRVLREFSFPFPRWAGKAFVYNESYLLATR